MGARMEAAGAINGWKAWRYRAPSGLVVEKEAQTKWSGCRHGAGARSAALGAHWALHQRLWEHL